MRYELYYDVMMWMWSF